MMHPRFQARFLTSPGRFGPHLQTR